LAALARWTPKAFGGTAKPGVPVVVKITPEIQIAVVVVCDQTRPPRVLTAVVMGNLFTIRIHPIAFIQLATV